MWCIHPTNVEFPALEQFRVLVVREEWTNSLPLDVLNLSTYHMQNDHDDNPSNELQAEADHRRGCSWLLSVAGEEGQAESTSFLASDRSTASLLGFANALQGTS